MFIGKNRASEWTLTGQTSLVHRSTVQEVWGKESGREINHS